VTPRVDDALRAPEKVPVTKVGLEDTDIVEVEERSILDPAVK